MDLHYVPNTARNLIKCVLVVSVATKRADLILGMIMIINAIDTSTADH